MGGSALVAIVAALLVFNVAGLRERLMSVVGAGLAPPSGAQQAAPLRIESIAVLPLENLSRDPEQEYFADGMTEELITNLGKISALRVISRTSVMRYKQTKKPLPEIARELNVDAVVEGSVLRSGDRVRITANLVHARTDRHLWAESYERDLRDVLALQSDVARAIAREVQVKVTPQEQTRLATVRRVDPRAHEAYFRGRYLFYSTGRIKEALAYFQQAVEIDPDYAQAYVDLSLSWGALDWFGELAPKEANAKAKAAVVKALEIDPMLAQAHAQLGRIHYHFEWAWAEAEREFRLAIELNPNSADAHEAYGFYLREMGRREESFREIERANELDPQVPGVNMRWFRHYWLLRDYEKVMEHARKVLELEPNNHWGHAYLGWAYHQKPMYAEAVAEFEKADALEPGSLFFKTGLGRAYADAGMKTKARRILRELEERSRTHYAHPFLIAIIYIGLRENDKAFEWLEKAYEDRSSHMVWLRVDPWLDPLRSDPRFQDLLRRMNFPP